MKRKGTLAVGLLLLLSLCLSGCGQKMTAEEILDKARQTIESTTDAHAVVAVSANLQGMEISATAEVWEKMPNMLRAVVLETSESDMAGTVLVSDGERGWFYQPTSNVVTVGRAGEMDTSLPDEMLGLLQDVLQDMLDASDAELVGEDSVADHDTYVVRVTPKDDAEQQFLPGNGTATLWVDKERWLVLKATYEASSFGDGTMEMLSFDLNPGLSDDLFQFQVPEGAKVIDLETERPQSLTLDEAKAQADFALLVPSYVPGGATLVEVLSMAGTVVLHYDHSPEVSFTIMQGDPLPSAMPLGASGEATVRGQEASVISDEAGGNTFLSWTENEVTMTLAGRISLEEALKVAESLE